MRIAIAGSSGFLGTHLVADLTGAGHEAVRLVRRPPRGPSEVRWDPRAGALDPAVLSTVDAVVNLGGANVGRYWTGAYRRKIRDSRVDTTATIARALAAVRSAAVGGGQGPTTWLNSSAVGFYGDTGARPVDEESPAGEGFLADLCRAWEAATGPAEDAGVRVVHLRTGLPLDREGGLLKPMLLPFRLGLGFRLGSGRQYLPWIGLPDWLGAVRLLLDRADLAGPVNLTGPEPVTNAEFTRVLANLLHRPALVSVPRIALRAALGGFGDESVASQRVRPGVLTKAGFAFGYPDVRAALEWALTHR
jgi:uncharacterized protein (TIGR01777 family)